MIHLRPLTPDDAHLLDAARNDPRTAGVFAWFGYPGRSLTERVVAGQAITVTGGNLAVVSDPQVLVGEVSWHQTYNGPPPHGACWSIGVFILADCRGKGYGTAAQRAIVDYLFATTPAVRIEASTEWDNVAERHALAGAGFSQEGVLRKAVFRAGQHRDMVMFSVVRDEWTGI